MTPTNSIRRNLGGYSTLVFTPTAKLTNQGFSTQDDGLSRRKAERIAFEEPSADLDLCLRSITSPSASHLLNWSHFGLGRLALHELRGEQGGGFHDGLHWYEDLLRNQRRSLRLRHPDQSVHLRPVEG
jgi:hypothetical protein